MCYIISMWNKEQIKKKMRNTTRLQIYNARKLLLLIIIDTGVSIK